MKYFNKLELLGKGAFGSVYLCEKLHNKQKLVVKEINTNLRGEELISANNEVSILRSLDHPNLIFYFDTYVMNGTVSIVMEYADKGTLQQLIAKERPNHFSPQFVMDIFCQILMGLNHIHAKKLIHKDLKCENVFLTGRNCDVVKIGDFGISKNVLSGQVEPDKNQLGTHNYLAPEIYDGKPYDIKSDIWALGCILYELCALQKMFEGPISNVVMSTAKGNWKRVNTKLYGKQMQEILDKMMQLDPKLRPTTEELMAHEDVFPTMYHVSIILGCL